MLLRCVARLRAELIRCSTTANLDQDHLPNALIEVGTWRAAGVIISGILVTYHLNPLNFNLIGQIDAPQISTADSSEFTIRHLLVQPNHPPRSKTWFFSLQTASQLVATRCPVPGDLYIMDGDPAVEPELDSFSLTFPLPYRVAFIIVFG